MRECIFFLCLWCGIIGGAEAVSPGIQHFDRYRSLLEGKKVGIVANQTAVLETGDGYKHSVDFLRDHQVQLIRIFCPEHGFRGDADAGETVGDYRDRQTGLPVISLYGKKKKPSPADLQGLDVVVFDMQDIGVVGKDTIVEEGRNVHEVLDLGFGSCRMCVCGPQDAKELLEHREVIRVATKYPKIAKDYFYNKKHQTVEIIKMNGSIELAPIVGLSEVIVDIVETGSTLKENGLTVLEEVCPLSARMIVNPVSMRMENDRIRDLIGRIRNLLEGETV